MPSYMINDGGLGSLFASAVGGGFDKRAEADAYRIRQAMDLAKNADERAAALNAAQTQLLGAKTADQTAQTNLFNDQVSAANSYGSALADNMAAAFLKSKENIVPETTDDLMIGLHARQPLEESRQYIPEHVRNLFDSQSRVAALSMPGNKPVETVKALQMLDPLASRDVGGGDAEAYGTLYPVLMKDGSLNYIQPTKEGGAPKLLNLPEGVAKALPTGITTQDLGTSLVTRDRSGNIIDNATKDVKGVAEQTAEGKAIAEARANLPSVENNANQMITAIDNLLNDPYLPSMTGPIDSWRTNVSGAAARVQSRLDQIRGKSFLQAFDQLRGGGAITEIEGQKATEAMARLNTAQNDEDFVAALNELRGIVSQALISARRKANGGVIPSVPADGVTTAPADTSSAGGEVRKTATGVQWSLE